VSQKNHHPLRLNVGFLLHQSVGYSREFEFSAHRVQVAEDLDVIRFQGALRLTRTAQGLYGQGHFEAQLPLECVRCLEPFPVALHVKVDDLFVYPALGAPDPLLAIPETGILDLNGLLREYLLLDVPIQPLCRPDCLGLCPLCGANRNRETCHHPDIEIDPRLEVLRTLLSES